MDDSNPYLAPRSGLGDRSRSRPRLDRRLLGALAVFLLNLPLAIVIALRNASGDAWIGVLLGLALLGLLGVLVCSISERVGFTMIVGGIGIALFQVVPILHGIAGLIALWLTFAAGLLPHPGQVTTWPAGFCISLVTGMLLMKLSMGLGVLLLVLTPPRWRGLATRVIR
ncbi:hypothetical protein [Tautonia rosea]|uniref:hypothetical protein n=1 Tax=Tautonia rosea TaxID=2728037 RepID=UPI0014765B74|nr:hypothetical protein [Tautonia rosea]